MTIIKSIIYGYLGAIFAGLAVALVGVGFGLSQEAVAAAAAPTGILFGLVGLSAAWWRPVLARIKSR